jgi:general secretion pathway protein I
MVDSTDRRQRNRGFTLIEVLVAVTIASLAFITLFKAAGIGIASTRVAGRYEEAVSRAQSHLAALGFDAKPIDGDLNGDDGGGYHWRLAVEPVAHAKPAKLGEDPDDGAQPTAPPGFTLYKVTVGIAWTEQGREREVVLETQRLGKVGGADPSDE